MTAAAGLHAAGLRVAFGARVGLAGIDLTVAAGERLALLGPSGSGKTSLLRTLAGLIEPLAGTVMVGGVDVTTWPPERRGVVYMHQVPSLFPHLNVRANVAFPLEVRGVSRAEAHATADEWLSRVRLADFGSRPPATLSGGQRHRVALARALAAQPRVLLLDEPFASLDPELRGDVRDTVLEVLAGHDSPAVVVVTHDVDEAAALGDRVAILLGGGVAQTGSPTAVFTQPASMAVARFLGTTNLVAAHRDDAGQVHSVFGCLPSPGAAGPLCLAIRPGHLRVGRASTDPADPAAGPVLCTPAVVEAILERAGGTFVRLRAGGSESPRGTPLLSALTGSPPQPGDAVVVTVASSAVHVIDEALTGDGDVR